MNRKPASSPCTRGIAVRAQTATGAAVITALRPQILPHITACFLETEQSTRQHARCGTTEQVCAPLHPKWTPGGVSAVR